MADSHRTQSTGLKQNIVEHTAQRQAERRRQIRGLLLLAMGVVVFILLRAGLRNVFTPGWWRVW